MQRRRSLYNLIKGMVVFMLLFVNGAITLQAQSTGDVDNNSIIDIVDALKVAQSYVGLQVVNFNTGVADVNCDGRIDIIDALIIAQYYVQLTPSFTQCFATATPSPTLLPAFAPDQTVFSNAELLYVAYTPEYKDPDSFYSEDTIGKALYHDNTISITAPELRTHAWYELSTDNRDEAYNWSVLSQLYSSTNRVFIEERETENFFEFTWKDASSSWILLSRIFKLSYIDRSMYNRLNPGEIIGKINFKNLSAGSVMDCVEYLWFYNNYNISGRKVLSAFGTEDNTFCYSTIYSISIVYGDFDLYDEITLNKDVYTTSKATGEINYKNTKIRTIQGVLR